MTEHRNDKNLCNEKLRAKRNTKLHATCPDLQQKEEKASLSSVWANHHPAEYK